ncbi:unnamed protein product, partial [Mesorhabditis spiculigera]
MNARLLTTVLLASGLLALCQAANCPSDTPPTKCGAAMDAILKALGKPLVSKKTMWGSKGYDIDKIGTALACGAKETLEPLYNSSIVPAYKKWCNKLDVTQVMNQICTVITGVLNNNAMLQKLFNNMKARSYVGWLLDLADPKLPKYWARYQSFRDKSTVACLTKPMTCNCSVVVSGMAGDMTSG